MLPAFFTSWATLSRLSVLIFSARGSFPKIHAGRHMDDDVRPPGKLCKILQAQPEVFFGYLARDAVHLLAAELPEPGGASRRSRSKIVEAAISRSKRSRAEGQRSFPDQQNDFIDIRNFPNDFSMTTFPKTRSCR